MTIKAYLLAAVAVFLVAVTGSDLVARTAIAGQTPGEALGDHLRSIWSSIGGLAYLFAPFGGAALICGVTDKRVPPRASLALFIFTMAALDYFYFTGFHEAQRAEMNRGWTAAVLWVWTLSLFVGVPVLIVLAIMTAVAAVLHRRSIDRRDERRDG